MMKEALQQSMKELPKVDDFSLIVQDDQLGNDELIKQVLQ